MDIRQASFVLALAVLAAPAARGAASVAPPSATIPNYNRVLIGQRAALEGLAYRARAADPDANWYNPAGLALVEGSSLSANVSALERTSLELKADGVRESTDSISLVPTFLGGATGVTPGAATQCAFGYSVAMPLFQKQKIDSDRSFTDAVETTEFVWNTGSDFEMLAPGIAMAWRASDRFSWGAGMRLYRTSLETVSASSTHVIEIAPPNKTTTLIQDEAIIAELYHLRFSAGAQLRPNDRCAIGLSLRSPGIRLDDSATFTMQGLAATDTFFLDISSRLTEMETDYMVPFEAGLGLAYTGERFEIELDVTYHDGLGRFAVFKSDEQIRIITDLLGNGNYIIVPIDFPTAYTYHDPVWNVSIGGRRKLKDGLWLHGGFYTDFSPVRDADDPIFKKIDMFGFTMGLTQEGEHHSFSFGLGYAFGESEEFEIDDLQSTQPLDATLEMSALSVVIAATFRF